MTDHELAEQLLAVVNPSGDDVLEGAIRAGEDAAAIIDLVEQAAIRRVRLSQVLVDAVADFADDAALDRDDIAAIREDLAKLRAANSVLR
ncbi:hypothetical protein [Mycobacterium talmoniae]|uniref:Uncharacterized protein n=1 Tax=Mycobacterium talmoniae TaxID=1858794 RepID=A0A1S1NE24_9MYCO|nr:MULTISPECIES: hypothetical protein [Mycobacterium]OHV03881.1 hypothetical protein BKN37_12675 [Mycobacterium talmoniae]TDH46013.1 hypothetical protein E2F47_27445 [Mycobacterium eburneum]